MKAIRTISRLLVGLVFMFSGFVKGVDPLGTAYKIEDYFLAFNISWAIPFALILSILLCTLEFGIGAALFFNLRIKKFSWVTLLVMLFFTGVTYYDFLYEPVPDCGCFGDFIKLSAKDTFLKNIVLLFFTLIIFFQRKKFDSIIQKGPQNFILGFFFVVFAGFSVYNYYEIPVLDFRDWKVGQRVAEENNTPPKVYLTYKNKENGETMEYISPNYPWNDSVWMSKWEFVSQRSEESQSKKLSDLMVEDLHGEDLTDYYLESKDYTFLVVAWNLEKASQSAFENKVLPLFNASNKKHYPFAVLTSSIPTEIEKFQKETHTENIEYLFADDIILKSMIRSNPGLIILKDGVIIAKYGFRSIPTTSELTTKLDIAF